MDDSLFNRLPAELRIKIYEYALTFDRVSCRPGETSRFWPERALTKKLALTQVCKQLRMECQHLPFTLNRLVVGLAPWGERFSEISALHGHTYEIAQDIEDVPSGFMSESITMSLDMAPEAKLYIFRYGRTSPFVDARMTHHWVKIKLFFGKLIRETQGHEFVMDVTPGDEKYGIHLWCEAGDHDPTETSLESRFELQAEAATECRKPGHHIFVANMNCASVIATANRHRHHDRSLCNVTKHADKLVAQVTKLEYCAGVVVEHDLERWNTSGQPAI